MKLVSACHEKLFFSRGQRKLTIKMQILFYKRSCFSLKIVIFLMLRNTICHVIHFLTRVHGANVFYFLFLSKAHGFEILCSKSGQSSSEQETQVSSNPLWRGFLDSLKKNGYFKVGKCFCVKFLKQMMQRFLCLRYPFCLCMDMVFAYVYFCEPRMN